MNKILITTPSLGIGGMERSVINFAKMFFEHKIEVKIFMISSNEVSIEVPNNIQVVYGKKKGSGKLLAPISLIKLRMFTKRFHPDYIISFSGRLSPFVILALLGVSKNVLPFHRSNPSTTYGKLIHVLNKKLYPSCKSLLVQTETAKNIFLNKYGNNNIIVIPNIARKLDLPSNLKREKIILNTSRLDKGKGLEYLIKMFHKINNPEWRLYVVGDGILRNKLEKLIDDLKLNDKIILLGYQNNVDFYLSKASIFAFTSESEGYPNALLEAMCAGLACISFDCPTGPSEMIKDGINGFLVPIGNQKEYIEKLSKLINDENLRNTFGEKAQGLNDTNSQESIYNNLYYELSKLNDYNHIQKM